MKERKGLIFMRDGKPYARLQFTDENGKKRDLWRKCESRSHARQVLKDLIREIDDNGAQAIYAANATFADLAAYFEQHYLKPAEYVEGRKVAGVRSLDPERTRLKALKAYFGKRRLRSITYGDIRSYRIHRLKTPTRSGGQRSIAAVNRELSNLRRMLGVALQEGWITRHPFNAGDPLINMADERKRERILTRDEEAKLLAACTGRRAHLRPIIIAALDTGCRLGEILKMRWRDVDFVAGVITIQAFNTKTMRERQVSMTIRLAQELNGLWQASTKDSNVRVFGFKNNVKRSFTGARRAAGLEDLRFHDLRHTHATRLDDLGFSLAKIGGQLGHTVLQTTLRYVNRDKTAVKAVAAALDAYNAEPNQPIETKELVN